MPSQRPLWTALLAAAPILASPPLAPPAQAQGIPKPDGPSARELALELTAFPRLAGTQGSRLGARVVARHLEAAGWQVELDEREVLLSLPRRLSVKAFESASAARAFAERLDVFDPDAHPPGDAPLFNAWSKGGRVRAPVVDAGRGLQADYDRLRGAGVDVRGSIALVRYGGAYRGVKVEVAARHGCVGVLQFSDPDEDGERAGATWPAGPFKPEWAAQRGAIVSIAVAPGDPSTPGWPSPAPGAQARRLEGEALAARLPGLPCLPIGAGLAEALIARLEGSGPGPVEVELDLDQPLELRPIVNVIATLPGESEEFVLAGNHRDAWVRGAHDAGSGTIVLLRTAQLLGWRARIFGYRPRHTIKLAFWDAEESGLIGSTEWAEAHADELIERCFLYVNADAAVSGTRLNLAGTPGLLGSVRRTLESLPPPPGSVGPPHEYARWLEENGGEAPPLELPGSGSDYTVFLHHLGLPMLDLSFGGNRGGQYHTAFDDFGVMDRYLDPGWVGHELAASFVSGFLGDAAYVGRRIFDPAEAARDLAERIAAFGAEEAWLGEVRAERLVRELNLLAQSVDDGAFGEGLRLPSFYRSLHAPAGLAERPWYKNRLWAPGLETGYAAEFLPALRTAAAEGEAALEAELASLAAAIVKLREELEGLAGR